MPKVRRLETFYEMPRVDFPVNTDILFENVNSSQKDLCVQVSGAAPLDPQVRGFLREIFGCMILESYGSTECCGSGSATSFANYQLEDGCVGPPQPWNEIKLESVEDMGYNSSDGVGEVCIRGDNVMIGKYIPSL